MIDLLLKWIRRPQKTTPLKRQLVVFTGLLCLSGLFLFLGYVGGYFDGTGTMPFAVGKQALLPPPIPSVTTTQEIIEFVEDDETDLNEYDIGFNCVEYALLLARNAHWEGIPAEVIRVDFTSGPSHMILAFPTNDNGWMFIDPATEAEIKPRVGGKLSGKGITAILILRTSWEPFELEEETE